ncbi:hypothetical protein AB0M54_30645 [Actinoplanes sp. NPDC051470]|uniref:hypothetical protein n=1 Tax=Actinoplanes sp. NPDC051470 TaxID=3157224 RepID=UPI00344915F6
MRNPSRRRKQAIAGAAGLAVVLGGATVAATRWPGHQDATVAVEVAPPADVTASPSPTGSSASATPKPKDASAKPTPSLSLPADAAERIADARAAAARDGVPVKRPLPQATVAQIPDDEVTVRESGSVQKDKATMRVVSARGDLTGQRELDWVADDGERFGDALCSQTITLSNMPPERKPTLLICWRTSAKKSVYTVAVSLDGHPSRKKSVSAIDAEWKRLG